MGIKSNKIADLKTASSTGTPELAPGEKCYITAVQNEAVIAHVKALYQEHGDGYPVKNYRRAIEAFINRDIGYGTALNLLIRAEIRSRKPQESPAKSRGLQSKKCEGESNHG